MRLYVTRLRHAKTAVGTEILFWVKTFVGLRRIVLVKGSGPLMARTGEVEGECRPFYRT